MDELPQVVWLRGDEPHCGDFALDAEAVMARLGIKRTRLTQISGRELRVGRIRRGRYVAPVYRAEDVEAYAAWTRPTASHQKSSQVLEDAARALAQQGDVVAERVHDDLEHLLAEVADDFHARGREQERLADERLAWLGRRLDGLERRYGQEQAAMAERLVALVGALGGMRTGLDRVVFLLESHNRELAEMKAAATRLTERVGGVEAGLEPRFALLEAGLGAIEDRLGAVCAELGQAVTGVQTTLGQAVSDAQTTLGGAQNCLSAAVAAVGAQVAAIAPARALPSKHISVYRRTARKARATR